jgi:hypothetical protein
MMQGTTLAELELAVAGKRAKFISGRKRWRHVWFSPLNRNLNRLALYILQTVQQPFGRSTKNSSATVSLYYKQFSNRFTELHVLMIPHTLQVRSVLFVYWRHTCFNPCHYLLQ